MKNLKENFVSILFASFLLSVVSYFAIDYVFSKKIQFREFEECISIASDVSSNWITRKDTIKYCSDQVF